MSKTVQHVDELVDANDRGARVPLDGSRHLLVIAAILWSLFQIYYASPLPFSLQQLLSKLGLDINVVLDDTKARSIHLAFALFLAYLSYPAFHNSPRNKIPWYDYILALVATLCALYYLLFYQQLVLRFGAPIMQDIVVGIIGVILLLEATRRTLGLPLVIIATVFLIYNYVGQYFPGHWIISHRTGTLAHIINQQWVTTEGVFGVALSVSTKYVFLFVLFGALLDKAGAGNYFIKTAFAFLGHMRGGPAKAAVVASGLTGLISGSSIANVVTTGTFTIPMMKRVGFSAEKAGAVEVASSVNGQIMPPVMGAAAFLMIEYVNMPYNELILHAFLPALISYIALVYIVHLEACKLDLKGLPRAEAPKPLLQFIGRMLASFILLCLVYFALDFGLAWIKTAAPNASLYIVGALLLLVYLLLLKRVAKFPAIAIDDSNSPVVKLPAVYPTVNSGLHFLLPVVVLIWCLMIERLSPGLSAFWGTMTLGVILLTQRPLLLFFSQDKHEQSQIWAAFRHGCLDAWQGLETGARNMIGIGIATATAGIIVGVVSLTGFGVQLSSIIEFLSQGNILLMLILVAVFSLILGMGLPTTANYIVVSSLMAMVIVEVGRQNGLLVPLIAVHLFVFYFGIMADVTPPVGLASFAAAAVSGGDPIKTGVTAFFYSLRTALLPFLFIFNTDILLINVSWIQGILVFFTATLAILAFTAATMGWFFTKNRWYETLLLLLASLMLFRPAFFMEYISSSERVIAPKLLMSELQKLPIGENMIFYVSGVNPYGKPVKFYAKVPVAEGKTTAQRLQNMGLELLTSDEKIKFQGREIQKIIIDNVEIDSPAAKAGLNWDQVVLQISVPRKDNLAKEWIFIPAVALLMFLAALQMRRRR